MEGDMRPAFFYIHRAETLLIPGEERTRVPAPDLPSPSLVDLIKDYSSLFQASATVLLAVIYVVVTIPEFRAALV
jgi:hypothetical protein